MANPLLLILALICSVILFFVLVAIIFSFNELTAKTGQKNRTKYIAFIITGIPIDLFLFIFWQTDGNLTKAIETALGGTFFIAIFVAWVLLRTKLKKSKPIFNTHPAEITDQVPTNQLHRPSQPSIVPLSTNTSRPDTIPSSVVPILRLLEAYANENGMTVVDKHSNCRNNRYYSADRKRCCWIDLVKSKSPLILDLCDTEHGILTIAESANGYTVLT